MVRTIALKAKYTVVEVILHNVDGEWKQNSEPTSYITDDIHYALEGVKPYSAACVGQDCFAWLNDKVTIYRFI